jgi:aconitate hydratase
MPYPIVNSPAKVAVNTAMLVPSLPPEEAQAAALEKTPNIASIPALEPLSDRMALPVLLKRATTSLRTTLCPRAPR